MKTKSLWLYASLMGLGCCGAAVAQNAPSSAEAAPTDTLGEVVITAERRHADLQQTPVAATVLSGATLAGMGVVTVDALQFATPGATINNFGQGIDFNIRGIGKAEHNSPDHRRRGDVPRRRGDIPRLLPGGALLRRRAASRYCAGHRARSAARTPPAARCSSPPTTPSSKGGYDGYVAGQVGNYSDFGVQGAINLPISDTLAARVAFNGESHNSFYDFTGPNGQPYTGNPGNLRIGSVRLGLLWQPSSALSVLFKTDYNYLDMGAYPADPFYDTNDLFQLTANAPQLAIDQFGRSVLKVEYMLPDGTTLRSVSGYQKGNTAYQADLDGTATGERNLR